jgi:hypothetical protein
MNEPDTKPDKTPVEIDATQAEEAAGGTCTLEDVLPFSETLTQTYENLVDFTSHVIERVAGK